ncbi:MAG: DoxX family protein [bacterium]|nr:DoxX family protein [bacterium]
MNVVLWVLQVLLAVVLVMAGGLKVVQGKAKLLEDPRMGWVGDFADSTIRTIGALEVAAAAGLILPWWLDIAPVLTPLAAVGVVAIQTGAMLTHRRRGEMRMFAMNAVLAAMAAFVVGRFGDL